MHKILQNLMLLKLSYKQIHYFLITLILIPTLFSAIYFCIQLAGLNQTKESLSKRSQALFLKEEKRAVNTYIWERFRHSDPYYIDKYLECLNFLSTEVALVEGIVNNVPYVDLKSIEERLLYLKGGDNQMHFIEGIIQTHPLFNETQEKLSYGIQVDENDVEKILQLIETLPYPIENEAKRPPQLILTDFSLDRQTFNGGAENFLLNLSMLKRTFSE